MIFTCYLVDFIKQFDTILTSTKQTEGNKMKLTQHTYQHSEKEFNLEVIGAGRKLVTTKDVETGDIVKFNRMKFEWMIRKGVFTKNEELSEA